MNTTLETLINQVLRLGYCPTTRRGITGHLEDEGPIFGIVTASDGELGGEINAITVSIGFLADNPHFIDKKRYYEVKVYKWDFLFSSAGRRDATVNWSSYGEVSGEVAGKMAQCMALAAEAATYLDKLKG